MGEPFLDLYEAGQATLAQAAKLSDLSVEELIELLGQAGVPAVSYSPEELAEELENAR
jgi:predicted HTH domain antitoxin